MNGQSEQVEGQALAASVLAALDREARPDWSPFVQAYRDVLLQRAGWYHARSDRLRREFSAGPDEVVQEFLACKVFPPERARSLLGPIARGEKPLRPRLLASLENHCIDLNRQGRRLPFTGGQVIEKREAGSHELPTVEAVQALIGRQMEAIRETFDRSPTRAPYREALLLLVRFDWVRALSGITLPHDSQQGDVFLNLQDVVRWTPWLSAEAARVINQQGMTLVEGWHRLEAILPQTPVPLTGEQIAEQIGVYRERWDAWISRGRRKVAHHLGSKYGQLFPHWPLEESHAAGGT